MPVISKPTGKNLMSIKKVKNWWHFSVNIWLSFQSGKIMVE
ncbi:hypothetical protein SSUD12_1243 [Streptococcus suis D12]|uniref:Uncharacterized protein n=1 Tax=Streptococcus suis D12 TaxID=1004952 RepID=G7SE64_STRSU|nr:hypothetical protein SSUD12_1243 [Streptococcus suis D12]